jgi:hypothetical protein
VDPAPAITPLAPATSTPVKATTRSASFLERHIGEVVAAAAGAIAEAVSEFRDGGLTPMSKVRAGS